MGARKPRDVLTQPAPPPDLVLRYGPGPEQVADLRFPPQAAAQPDGPEAGRVLVVLLHGGFWRAAFDRTHIGSLAAALAAENFVVCVPEFRRVGQSGGGWPGTFEDVAAAAEAAPGLAPAPSPPPDPDPARTRDLMLRPTPSPGGRWSRVVLAGHSAGGHLALWAAARHRLPRAHPWHAALSPLLAGVVALAPVSDLAACYQAGLDGNAAGELLGGGPDEQPDRYAAADPARLLPLGVPVHLVHGTADERVPAAMSRDFAARAGAAGDAVTLTELPGTGHFELIDPRSEAWPAVLAAFRSVAAAGFAT